MPKIVGLLLLCCLIFSCKKDIEHTEKEAPDSKIDFLFNVPIVADTVFIDKQYNIDIRVAVTGYSIDSVIVTNNNGRVILACDTTIISSRNFCKYENLEKVDFLIRTVNLVNKKIVYFKSPALFKAVENLSNRYVHPSVDEGKLKLTWQEFDKNNTQKYFIERWIIDNDYRKKYYQVFEVKNAEFFDDYYVGEEAEYKITIINKSGNKQDIWYYKKPEEQPNYYVTQNSAGGYKLHFSKCKYFNNFGQYYLTDGYNFDPTFIHSTDQVNDTTLILADAGFGGEARFWLRYLPKQFPDGFLEDDWVIYGKYLFFQYGIASISYENIAILDNNNIAYTENGKIFQYNIINNQVVDSIVKKGVYYGFLRTTPAGKYIYAIDEKIYHSVLYLWQTTPFSSNPIYTFQTNFIIPPISDNLITIMSPPGYSSNLSLYNVANGSIIYTTNYYGNSNYPTVSPNGNYFFIHDMGLKLCSYINNSFKVIWEETDWTKYYQFYSFNRLNNDLCYVWDDNKIFSNRKTSDFSVISSFPLDLEEIVDIDCYSNKIMGYVTGKVMIYDLNNGNLIKEIPANLSELFFYSNKTVLLGNTLYNNNGIKYELNQ